MLTSLKLIAFDIRTLADGEAPPTLAGLAERARRGDTLTVEELRRAGLPVVGLLLERMESGQIKTLLEEFLPEPQTIFPKMLEVEGQTYKRIMIGELTEIEAAQFLKPEEVRGDNAGKLRRRLRKPSGKALTYLNVDDDRKIIEGLNKAGGKYRFMTDAEVEALSAEVRAQLTGTNWFLVETSRGSGRFHWRSLLSANQYDSYPEDRFSDDAVRLVENR